MSQEPVFPPASTKSPTISLLKEPLLKFCASCMLLTLTQFAQAKLEDGSDFKPIAPEKEQMQTNALIAYQLQRYHYRDVTIDDNMSETVFNSYIKALDNQKLYFFASDIEEFRQYEKELDTALKLGQLDPAFRIYNRYERRVIERLQYSLKLLDKGIEHFDFTLDESVKIDREKEPWIQSEEQMNDLWRKRVKSAILSLKLTDKKPEEILKTLKKRYQSQLTRLLQTNNEDAFQIYMNSFTMVFDPHTQYLSPKTSENFNINMSLSLEGIGAVLQSENEYTKILRLVPAGPADKQGGLQPADRIVGVGQGLDGEIVDVVGWRLDEVVDLIRGPKQSTVRLKVLPAESKDENETKEVAIVRDKVDLDDQAAQSSVMEVESNGRKLKFGVIEIPTFYADFQAMQRGDANPRRTSTDVRKLLDELVKQKVDGLIVDLRNNGGGSLGEANDLTGLFIDEGPTVQIRYARSGVEVLRDTEKGVAYEGPLAILVNRMSASASEIFAAAMQDYGRAVIVGDQTFGKGTVQQIRPLKHGQLKLTQAKFYRVSGASTQHKGVMPDIVIPSPIDKSEIGEDALPEALPWDQINKVEYQSSEIIKSLTDQLQAKHEERMKDNKLYKVLLDEINFLKNEKSKEYLSLNEAVRKKEKEQRQAEQLRLVNIRRAANDEQLIETFDALEEEGEKIDQRSAQAQRDEKVKQDLMIDEGARVLIDIMELQPRVAEVGR